MPAPSSQSSVWSTPRREGLRSLALSAEAYPQSRRCSCQSEGEEGAAARAGALLLGGGEGEQDRALDCEIEVGVGDESCAALS